MYIIIIACMVYTVGCVHLPTLSGCSARGRPCPRKTLFPIFHAPGRPPWAFRCADGIGYGHEGLLGSPEPERRKRFVASRRLESASSPSFVKARIECAFDKPGTNPKQRYHEHPEISRNKFEQSGTCGNIRTSGNIRTHARPHFTYVGTSR